MNKLLFPILSILAAVGLWFLYIGPTYENIQTLQAKEAEFDNAFLEAREARNLLDELETTYSGISQENLERLNILLPTRLDMARVVQNVGEIFASFEVPVEEIRVLPGQPGDEPGLVRHTVDFSVDAQYADFLDIIEALDTNLQLATVVGLELEAVLDEAQEEEVGLNLASTQYNLTLTFYSYE